MNAQVDSGPTLIKDKKLAQDTGFKWVIGCLAEFETFFKDVPVYDRFVCFADPSTYPTYPGWMLRNLLALVRFRWKLENVQILCYRDIQSHRDDARSLILKLSTRSANVTVSNTPKLAIGPSGMPKVTGWERNGAGKITSKIANLGEFMNPERFRECSLNRFCVVLTIYLDWLIKLLISISNS